MDWIERLTTFYKPPLGDSRRASVVTNTLHEGDPSDRTLNFFERRYYVPQKIRSKAHSEKCANELQDYTTCVNNSNKFSCVPKNRTLKKCISQWSKDKDFMQECAEEYLNERSYFRTLNMSI